MICEVHEKNGYENLGGCLLFVFFCLFVCFVCLLVSENTLFLLAKSVFEPYEIDCLSTLLEFIK